MVPINNNHIRTTSDGTFVKQNYGGTVVGTADTTLVNGILIKDINTNNIINTGPKEASGDKAYTASKVLSGGAFAYNQSTTNTWIISRVTTALAGVANTVLQFMGEVHNPKPFPYYTAKYSVNNTLLVRKNLYSRTGYDTSGNKIVKRTTWVTNPSGTLATDFGVSTQLPTRSVPGEFVMLNDFTDYAVATSSNFFDYAPITGK